MMNTSQPFAEPDFAMSASILRKDCPSQSVLEMLASKWSVLILYALRNGKRRYSELQHIIGGISQKMLTQTLRDLERDGLVKRTVFPVVPPHTEYELTTLGQSLEGVIYDLGQWAQQHLESVLVAREEYEGLKQQPM